MAPKMGLQMAPNRAKMGHLGGHRAGTQEAGAILKALVSKMAPRWLKMAPSASGTCGVRGGKVLTGVSPAGNQHEP
jgi:hypothetical protein